MARRPRLAALVGALCIAFSGLFYLYADVSPATGTVYRAFFGLPLLVFVAVLERRRFGPLPCGGATRIHDLTHMTCERNAGNLFMLHRSARWRPSCSSC